MYNILNEDGEVFVPAFKGESGYGFYTTIFPIEDKPELQEVAVGVPSDRDLQVGDMVISSYVPFPGNEPASTRGNIGEIKEVIGQLNPSIPLISVKVEYKLSVKGDNGADGTNGTDGITPNIQIGTVTTLEPEQPATVTRAGTDEEPVFNFGIPRGNDGEYNSIDYLKDPDKTYLVIKTPTDNDTFYMLTGDTGSPDYTIEWGDGSIDNITDTSRPSHTYEKAGMYIITISGDFANGIVVGSGVNLNKNKMIEVYGGSNYPESVGDYAFYMCPNLTIANFPNATSVGSYAFYVCLSLTTANFPSVTNIGNQAFSGCSNLTIENLPNVTSISSNAFAACSNLTTANFPNATSISTNAFQYCTNLTTATFPNVTNVGYGAFDGCTNLTIANFPNATSVEDRAFRECPSLKTLTLGNVTTTATGTRFENVKLINLKIAQDVDTTDIDRITQFYSNNGGTFTGAVINSI